MGSEFKARIRMFLFRYFRWARVPCYMLFSLFLSFKFKSVAIVIDSSNHVMKLDGFSRFSLCLLFTSIFIEGVTYNIFTLLSSFEGILDNLFIYCQYLPVVKSLIKKEQVKLKNDMRSSLKSQIHKLLLPNPKLPEVKISRNAVLELCQSLVKENSSWLNGKVSGTV